MDLSFVSGLILGCFTGLAGKYVLQKIKVKRKYDEVNKNKHLEWDQISLDYPQFTSQLREDINNPEYKNIREFFVVEQHAILNTQIPRLRYDVTDEIILVVNRLERLGFIEQVKTNCLLYKMKDDFIALLRSVHHS
ncbi:hypothetical protein [Legionella quateirensis]|uniref:Uncharacterized protein n=1 Tax=Legionella quateirensis TaxID=45072 RepID=A0A378KQQ6_9GAMM|nr:hypothetical protein [Legionella quateirensis]KTD54733.1 hypothetical protein Lqua_0240 [Legionella quateirensis]STY16913.1 Uncharacterised protein [Legionella quateirensis]